MKRSLGLIGLLVLLLATPATRGDGLRNVKVGGEVPPFTVATLTGGDIDSETLRGKVVVLVYVSAEQQSSEKAIRAADRIRRELRGEDLAVVFMTADVTRVGYFRGLRDRLDTSTPFGLDVARKVYGELGLFVLPTTIIVNREGRLARVISSYKSDYEHVLRAHVRHTLGLIDDATLETELEMKPNRRDRPADRIARRRAAARLLRENGLLQDAENELRAALEIDADDADTLLDLAALCISQDRFDEAETLVGSVMAEGSVHRRGKLLAGIVLYHRGKLDEAGRTLEEALLLNPDPVLTHYYLGLIAEQQGDETAAIRHFKESLGRLLRDRAM